MANPKRKRTKKANTKPKPKQGDVSSIPAGAVPQIVNQRVYEFIPVFRDGLQAIHEVLEEIRELLKEE